jgi:hypothetical protein
MVVLPLGQPVGTDPKGVLFNDVNAPSCTTPLTSVLGTLATPKFGIVTLNVSCLAAAHAHVVNMPVDYLPCKSCSPLG